MANPYQAEFDKLELGTILSPRTVHGQFVGTTASIPDGWVLADGRRLGPSEHDFSDEAYVVPNKMNDAILGTSNQINKYDPEGHRIGGPNHELAGVLPIIKVRKTD